MKTTPRKVKSATAVSMLPYEMELLKKRAGVILALWRRQGRKTTTMARRALLAMMKHPGILVTFASASIAVGQELILREAQVLRWAFAQFKTEVEAAGMKFESNGDGLALDDFADLFEHSKLESRIWHDSTTCSRTKLIAPNPATARGYSGLVMLDEIGFIQDLRALWEAMEPIISSNPTFTVLMATTPPEDEDHYSYEMVAPKEPLNVAPNAKGHWYESQAGFLVHRVDVDDAAAAGLKMYGLKTREEITPEQHRAEALNRDAWDRNYKLIFTRGGSAAVSRLFLQHAMEAGRGLCLAYQGGLPPDDGWMDLIGNGRLGLGYDVATTNNGASNPSSLALVEEMGRMEAVRLLLRWRTADPEESRVILRTIIRLLKMRGRKLRRLCIDATNERYFATDLKGELVAQVPVELIIGGAGTSFRGEDMDMKTYLGSMMVNAFEDAEVLLPYETWVRDDFRLVKKDKGRFVNETDTDGNHGDCFDSTKMALHALRHGSGPVEATACPVGLLSGVKQGRAGILNPYAPENQPGRHFVRGI